MDENKSRAWARVNRTQASFDALAGGLVFAALTAKQLGEKPRPHRRRAPERMRLSASAGGDVPILANVGRGDMTQPLVEVRPGLWTRPNWNCRESEAFPVKRVGPASTSPGGPHDRPDPAARRLRLRRRRGRGRARPDAVLDEGLGLARRRDLHLEAPPGQGARPPGLPGAAGDARRRPVRSGRHVPAGPPLARHRQQGELPGDRRRASERPGAYLRQDPGAAQGRPRRGERGPAAPASRPPPPPAAPPA
jgi:hypothetical protein